MSIPILRALACSLALAAVSSAAAPAAGFPDDSVYRLQVALTGQRDTKLGLDAYAGRPTIVSMFYASCPHICPMLISSVQTLEKGLSTDQRGRLRVLFVSLDPADDAKALAALVATRGVDGKRWTLASASADDVRLIAAALGVRYKQLPDKSFSHSTILTLLDGQGRVLRRTEAFTDPEPEFRQALAAALR